MGDIEINRPFQAPLSPWQANTPLSQPQEIGHKLFDCTSDFYAWYMSWDTVPSDHPETFRALSQIMKIAQTSYEGGNYLRESEEKEALQTLSQLRERLFYGNMKTDEILSQLTDVLQTMISQNPKARVVAHATELEYVFCIQSKETNPSLEDFQQYLHSILKMVNPSLLEIHAHAIAQSMAMILEQAAEISDPKSTLEQALQRWIT